MGGGNVTDPPHPWAECTWSWSKQKQPRTFMHQEWWGKLLTHVIRVASTQVKGKYYIQCLSLFMLLEGPTQKSFLLPPEQLHYSPRSTAWFRRSCFLQSPLYSPPTVLVGREPIAQAQNRLTFEMLAFLSSSKIRSVTNPASESRSITPFPLDWI